MKIRWDSFIGKKVLVTTELGGVFFGTLKEVDQGSHAVVLHKAQNCISWSSTVKGVFGLAVIGPDESCRIGPVVPEIFLEKVASVSKVTNEAARAWGAQPWKE